MTTLTGLTALRQALSTLNLAIDVEEHAKVATLIPRDASVLRALAEPSKRREIMRLAATHGFTHAALELTPDLFDEPDAATVRRD